MRIIERLAQEPAAVGTVVASVLPALALFGLVSFDATQISVLVVSINAVVGFMVRLLVEPSRKPALAAQPDPTSG